MVNALILIGGQSKRMGRDKYLLNIHGKSQYIHLYEMLTGMNISTFLSCNKGQEFEIPDRYSKIVDDYHSIGPIGGLVAAINNARDTSWLLVACDLINLNVASVQSLIQSNDQGFEVVTYQLKDVEYYETTCTIYNPGVFPKIEEAVKNGRYSLRHILRNSRVKILSGDQILLANANTPEDLG